MSDVIVKCFNVYQQKEEMFSDVLHIVAILTIKDVLETKSGSTSSANEIRIYFFCHFRQIT